MKKVFPLLFALLAVLSLTTLAFAAEDGTEDNPWQIGADGDEVTAYIDSTTLYIQGSYETESSRMADFASAEEQPWREYADKIDSIFVWSCSNIGSNAFRDLGASAEFGVDFYLDTTVAEIGESAFESTPFADYVILNIAENLTGIGTRAFADTGLQRVDFMGKPIIANDAFSGVTAVAYTVYEGAWSDADKKDFGGALTYKNLFAFETEDCADDGMTGNGCTYYPEDEECYVNANFSDEYEFDHWEIVEGNLAFDDPANPEQSFYLTGNAKAKTFYRYVGESADDADETDDTETAPAEAEPADHTVQIVIGVCVIAACGAVIAVRKKRPNDDAE